MKLKLQNLGYIFFSNNILAPTFWEKQTLHLSNILIILGFQKCISRTLTIVCIERVFDTQSKLSTVNVP